MLLDLQPRSAVDAAGRLVGNSSIASSANGTYGTVIIPPSAVNETTRFVGGRTYVNQTDPNAQSPYPTDNLVFGNYTFQLHAIDANGNIIEPFYFLTPIFITLYYDLAGTENSYEANGGVLPANSTQLNSSEANGGQTVPQLMYWDVTTDTWQDAAQSCSPPNITIDPVAFSYTIAVCHLTSFGSGIQLSPIVSLHAGSLAPTFNQTVQTDSRVAVLPGAFLYQQSLDPYFTPSLPSYSVLSSPVYLLDPQESVVNGSVLLDGCSSYDPDGFIGSFDWRYSSIVPNTVGLSGFSNRTRAAGAGRRVQWQPRAVCVPRVPGVAKWCWLGFVSDHAASDRQQSGVHRTQHERGGRPRSHSRAGSKRQPDAADQQLGAGQLHYPG